MFLTKRKFFSRKNKISLYAKYKTDYDRFEDTCDGYKSSIAELIQAIDDHRHTEHIRTYLSYILNNNTGVGREEICYKYLDTHNLLLDVDDYSALTTKIKKMTRAIGEIGAALDLVRFLDENELAIRRIK